MEVRIGTGAVPMGWGREGEGRGGGSVGKQQVADLTALEWVCLGSALGDGGEWAGGGGWYRRRGKGLGKQWSKCCEAHLELQLVLAQ